jgi:hypothetical protein
LGPWPGYTGKPFGADQIPARGLTGGEGKVGEKTQELTAVTVVAGVREERVCGGVSTANRDGRRRSEGGGSVLVARVSKGGEEAAGKLLRDDVVLLVPLAGARGQWIAGTTARPSGGGSPSSSALWSGQSSAGDRNWVGL